MVEPAESWISRVRISLPEASQKRSCRLELSVADGFVIASVVAYPSVLSNGIYTRVSSSRVSADTALEIGPSAHPLPKRQHSSDPALAIILKQRPAGLQCSTSMRIKVALESSASCPSILSDEVIRPSGSRNVTCNG